MIYGASESFIPKQFQASIGEFGECYFEVEFLEGHLNYFSVKKVGNTPEEIEKRQPRLSASLLRSRLIFKRYQLETESLGEWEAYQKGGESREIRELLSHLPGPCVLHPEMSQWKEFRQTLNRLNVWNWQREYDHDSLDGTSWSLRIEYDDCFLVTFGFNCYPDTDGTPFKESERSPCFNRYLAAIRRLIGGREFC